MIEIIFETIEEKLVKIFNNLRTTKILLSSYECCKVVTLSSSTSFDLLVSNHEEADTKVIAHAYEFLKHEPSNNVIIRSPSGDTDIIVLAVSLLFEFKKRTSIENGTGKERKMLWLDNRYIAREKSFPNWSSFVYRE